MSPTENRYASPSFLAKPPRSVPLALRIRLLLGGFLNQFGWFFLGFGMIFVWVFGLNSDPWAMVDFGGELETCPGEIRQVVRTNMSEGGSENSDGTPIYRYSYGFEYNGESFSGDSYALGQRRRQGDRVVIEFPVGKPQRSRIQGMRSAPFSALVLLVLIFPLIGTGFVVYGFRAGMRASYLLKHGEYTTGRLIDKQPTGASVNNQPVYKLNFEFRDGSNRKHEAIAKTHQPQHLEDEDHEPLVYDPLHPERATLLDHLPGSPRFDPEGRIRNASLLATLVSLIIPAVSIVGHSLAFYWLVLK